MAVAFPVKDRYSVEDLRKIMAILRTPDGCPWDREQTHESIRSNLLEETHEALEAIDKGDMEGLREELGDVLMQVVFHAQMEEEAGGFTFDDVVDEVAKKLIVRHPHVFADVQAADAAAVLQNWDAIKRRTKGEGTTQADLLRNVPRALPALMRAGKVQNRAKRVGFDWPEAGGAWEALESELKELKAAIAAGEAASVEEELGDLLFSAVNVSRFLHVDAEQALTASTDKFIRRFDRMEQLANEAGRQLADATLDEMNAWWDEAKRDTAAD